MIIEIGCRLYPPSREMSHSAHLVQSLNIFDVGLTVQQSLRPDEKDWAFKISGSCLFEMIWPYIRSNSKRDPPGRNSMEEWLRSDRCWSTVIANPIFQGSINSHKEQSPFPPSHRASWAPTILDWSWARHRGWGVPFLLLLIPSYHNL